MFVDIKDKVDVSDVFVSVVFKNSWNSSSHMKKIDDKIPLQFPLSGNEADDVINYYEIYLWYACSSNSIEAKGLPRFFRLSFIISFRIFCLSHFCE